jgi:hypothetical protein
MDAVLEREMSGSLPHPSVASLTLVISAFHLIEDWLPDRASRPPGRHGLACACGLPERRQLQFVGRTSLNLDVALSVGS